MANPVVAVLGATSLVGGLVISFLREQGSDVRALSRKAAERTDASTSNFIRPQDLKNESIESWICLAPIWVLKDYFELMSRCGVRRVVALSSTSLFTKRTSSDMAEQALAEKLREGETSLMRWAQAAGVEWVILRPTLIYGFGLDKNVSEIVRIIQRLGIFPLLGKAEGLRQPVHATDVAQAAVAALATKVATNRAYNLSGGETLPYRLMVERIFIASGRRPRFISVPLPIFKMAVACLRVFPRYRGLTSAMADRMNQNLVFDHSDAVRDLRFDPRKFELAQQDLLGS